jgi:hypothetical protein
MATIALRLINFTTIRSDKWRNHGVPLGVGAERHVYGAVLVDGAIWEILVHDSLLIYGLTRIGGQQLLDPSFVD